MTRNQRGEYYCDMWYKVTPDAIIRLASRWIDLVSKATGRDVVIYTNVKAW
jgi:hypothetical protein